MAHFERMGLYPTKNGNIDTSHYDDVTRFTTVFISTEIDRYGNVLKDSAFCGIMHRVTDAIQI